MRDLNGSEAKSRIMMWEVHRFYLTVILQYVAKIRPLCFFNHFPKVFTEHVTQTRVFQCSDVYRSSCNSSKEKVTMSSLIKGSGRYTVSPQAQTTPTNTPLTPLHTPN